MRSTVLLLAGGVAWGVVAGEAAPIRYRIDPEGSMLAVVTHRDGVAARLAHDHLITTPVERARLELDPTDPERTVHFSLSVPVSELGVDDAALRQRFSKRLVELGVLPEPGLPPLDAGDARKVREAMLSPGQLDAARHSTISVELLEVFRRGAPTGSARIGLPWSARLRWRIRGVVREISVPIRYELREDGRLELEAVGEAEFRDFGIEPYSALLGAIRNAPNFHFVALVVARPEAGTDPTSLAP